MPTKQEPRQLPKNMGSWRGFYVVNFPWLFDSNYNDLKTFLKI